jgi:hypothetical protein
LLLFPVSAFAAFASGVVVRLVVGDFGKVLPTFSALTYRDARSNNGTANLLTGWSANFELGSDRLAGCLRRHFVERGAILT